MLTVRSPRSDAAAAHAPWGEACSWGGLGCPGPSMAWGAQGGIAGAGERPVRRDLARLDHTVLDRAGEQCILARRGPPGGRVLGAGAVDVLPDRVLAY